MASTPTSKSSTDQPSHLLEVGKVAKPHGLTGEVVVQWLSDRVERLTPGRSLQAEDAWLLVTSSRPHQGRYLVRFEGFDTREAADTLRGAVLRAEAIAENDPEVLWVHEVIGAVLQDAAGVVLGTVNAVQANPASDLLVLDNGGLVPSRFVIAREPGVITAEIPEGLLDNP